MADKRAYAKFDVGYLDNPKVGPLLEDDKPYAVILHAASIMYAAQHLTNGVVRVKTLLRKTGASQDDVRALFDAGLWHDLGDGQAEVHDYLEHNRSAEQAQKATDKARKAAQVRYEQAASTANAGEPGSAPSTSPTDAPGTASSSAPSMPIEREKEREKNSRPSAPRTDTRPPGSFDTFWAAYPRKEAKRNAEKAYLGALKRTGGDATPIILGARRYAADPNREQAFTALPATWLNGDRWGDDPLPARVTNRPADAPRPGAGVWDQRVTDPYGLEEDNAR
ncbi:hypothetical protein [Cellulosimicrobium sp. Marseille-Q8652]